MAFAIDEAERDLTNERGGELGANRMPLAFAALGGAIAMILTTGFVGVLMVAMGVVVGGLVGMGFVEARRMVANR
jgi:hypothetical protein